MATSAPPAVIHAEIPKGRGTVVRVSRIRYNGWDRIDVREFYSPPEDPGSSFPTRRGISVPLAEISSLRAALEEAERAARADGLLT